MNSAANSLDRDSTGYSRGSLYTMEILWLDQVPFSFLRRRRRRVESVRWGKSRAALQEILKRCEPEIDAQRSVLLRTSSSSCVSRRIKPASG